MVGDNVMDEMNRASLIDNEVKKSEIRRSIHRSRRLDNADKASSGCGPKKKNCIIF